MNTIASLIRDTWDTTVGRLFIAGLAFGFAPFYLLSTVHAALQEVTSH